MNNIRRRYFALPLILTFLILFSGGSAQNNTPPNTKPPVYLVGSFTTVNPLSTGGREASTTTSNTIRLHAPIAVVGMRQYLDSGVPVRAGVIVETLVNGEFVATEEIMIPDDSPHPLMNRSGETIRFRPFVQNMFAVLLPGAVVHVEFMVVEAQNF